MNDDKTWLCAACWAVLIPVNRDVCSKCCGPQEGTQTCDVEPEDKTKETD
jgi:hypothetical protein